MKRVLEYIKTCIDRYKCSNDDTDKAKYIENICLLYVATVSLCSELNSTCQELNKVFTELFQHDKFAYSILKKTLNINTNNLISNNDLAYLYELFNIIDLKMSVCKITNENRNDLLKFIGLDSDYFTLINYLNTKIIYDSNFKTSYYVNLVQDDMILLRDFNIVTYIHEITHAYTKQINNIYSETPSILIEKGLESFYKLGDNNNRIIDINSMHYFSEGIVKNKKEQYQSYFMYVVGTIISISFINKYGNDFKTIKNGIDFINNNYNLDLISMFKRLNLNEDDIYNGFKNKEKILIKK